jgi:hypothetical protein
MRPQQKLRLLPWRIALMTLLVLGLCGTAVLLVHALPDSLAGNVIAAGMGCIFLLLIASVLEWLVHRYVYHRRVLPFLTRIYAIHHRGHHRIIFPTWRYVTNGPTRRHPILQDDVARLHPPGWRNLPIKLAHFGFYMTIGAVCIWLPAWLLTHHMAFLLGILVTSVIVSDLFVRVHDAIHYPGIYRLIEAQPWFHFLDVHHYIHHVDTEANVNFLLPLADWLFGTMRRSLTPDELARHGSLREAKAVPVGMSEPAREVARPRLLRA